MTPEKQTALYQNLFNGMSNQDLALLNTILTPDFTLTHMTGIVQSKKAWLQDIQNEQMRYFSFQHETIDCLTNQLTGQTQVDARIYGSRHTWPLQLTLSFENEQISSAIATTY